MATPDELVQQAISYFFDTALPQASGKQFADLPSPSVHLGSYTAWDNTPVASTAGLSLTPAYVLRASAPLPVLNNKPNAAGVTAPTTGPARHLLWVREVADAAVDDAAEIQRVMADLDTFVALFGGSDAGPAAGAPQPAAAQPGAPTSSAAVAAARSAEWAAAIVAARASLAVNLSTLTAVPAGLDSVAPDLPALKEVLQHFFTYAPDGSYYPRWAGAGRDAANPDHLTATYKQNNVLERQLERDQAYLYGFVPESVLSNRGDLGSGAFREFIVRFDPTGVPTNPFRLATVHTVRTRSEAAPFSDFVFFAASAGQGLPVPRSSVVKMSAGLINLVGDLAAAAAAGDQQLNSKVFGASADGIVRANLMAMVQGEPTWPPGVICNDTGDVRVLQTPAEQIAAVAALPEVTNLAVFAANELHNDQARAMVNWPALDAKLPVGTKGGQGVLIGIIDSGIDGSHPAFAGRLHAVWDQGRPAAVPAGNPPSLNHPVGDPLNAAYATFNFGVELTGAATATSVDIDYANPPGAAITVPPAHGHGTHVSATAAGAEVRDAAGNVLVPAGVAPLARIAVVRTIQAGARDGDDVIGARWIFQKATELGVPCVINMSYGHHNHGHDGTDDNATALLRACRDAANNYLPGRVIVASAGNERKVPLHVRRQIPAHSGGASTAAIINLPPSFRQGLDIWIRDPTGTKPLAFPMSVYFYRITARRNTFRDVSQRIRLGANAVGATPAGLFVNHNTKIQIATFVSHPLNGDHRFRVLFSTTSAPTNPAPAAMITNQWGVVLINDSDKPVDVHMWLTGGAIFADATGDEDHAYMIGQPAASAAAISVASAVSRLVYRTMGGQPGPPPGNEQSQIRELSTFSNPGPLRPSSIPPSTFETVAHEINGIDVTAPGGFTQSAMSSQVPPGPNAAWVVNNLSRIMTGTSQAAPVITGLVANILAAEPTLTMPQVLARLKAASTIPTNSDFQPPPGSGPKPLSPDWGYGLIDAGALRP